AKGACSGVDRTGFDAADRALWHTRSSSEVALRQRRSSARVSKHLGAPHRDSVHAITESARVALHRSLVADRRPVWILAGRASGAPLMEQVPALVQRHLELREP